MRADDWIIDYLVNNGVTDVFGIPGVVVMDFLYAVDKRKPEITPHLNYHEQGSSFAACGYAQSTGKLCVAYSTRGPGFTNMLTAMADAYYDSVPVMFITAHSARELKPQMRVMDNQEIDTVELAKSITKRSVRVDSIEELQLEVIKAYYEATTGRKGPVFLDILNSLFQVEVGEISEDILNTNVQKENSSDSEFVDFLEQKLSDARRPIILIGNGVRKTGCVDLLKSVAERFSIPILSSRAGQDVVPDSEYYYGFVGSRATRYSNFILSKSDLIISLGNRLSFPVNSKSFQPVVENSFTIRIDIDESEFSRQIPNAKNIKMDCMTALSLMEKTDLHYNGAEDWLNVCRKLKKTLDKYDSNNVINKLVKIIDTTDPQTVLTCDVGNHSFWVTSAYAYASAKNRIIYSGSFGTLGSALPKSIGAYYTNKKPVICFTGDQGVQFNIQELLYIAKHRLPIKIVVLNNSSSGMIMEREKAKYGDYLVHTTVDSGYDYPNFEKLADCYGLGYTRVQEDEEFSFKMDYEPTIIEIMIDPELALEPSLPIGKVCQDLSPELPRDLYRELDAL